MIADYRRYDKDVEDVAAQCRADMFTDELFDIVGVHAGGGSGALPVVMRQSRRSAWIKPDRIGADPSHTAHEKIAADLGFDLRLPVSPVILSKRTNEVNVPPGMVLPPIVAISYPTLIQGKPWDNSLAADVRANMRPSMSAMFPFLAWLDDHDHMGGANMRYEIVASGPRVSFFDFSFSLTREWKLPGQPKHRDWWAAWPHPFNERDSTAISDILDRFEGFSVKDLERIITGMPPDCMSSETKCHLTTALDQRRMELRRVLNTIGAP